MQLGRLSATSRVQHGYGNTHSDQVTGTMGMGMVLEFGTLWHTVYPDRGIMGISQVCYNRVSIDFNVLKLVFSLI
jgi:hypothetical protein